MQVIHRSPILLAACLLLLPFVSCHRKSGGDGEVKKEQGLYVHRTWQELELDSGSVARYLEQHPAYSKVAERISVFYEKRKFRCAWIDSEGPNDRSLSLVNLLANALDEGVVLKSLDLDAMQSMFDSLPADTNQGYVIADATVRFELELTANYFLMADAAAIGLPVAKRRSLEWYLSPGRRSPEELAEVLSDTSRNEVVLPHPEDSMYHRLQRALKSYRSIAVKTVWNPLALPLTPIRPGERSGLLPELKWRLSLLGDLTDTVITDAFDTALGTAVERYRNRHSLPAGPFVDSSFVSSLNIPPDDRVRQLLVNMERCRWLPKFPKGDYLIVNIPEYRLRLFRNDLEAWSCPVIVGKSTTRTTVLSGRMKEVVFSPYWNVPKSIVVKELLPEIKADPRRLNSYHLEVRTIGKFPRTVPASAINWKKVDPEHFPYELRQVPGPWNSLGQVKFVFPNNFGIYLHDTPSKGLFAQEQRMFSHGCIRVAAPVRLAKELLDDPYWTTARIRREMESGTERSVALKKRIPLLVVYFTCWVDEAGLVHFAEDGYGHDARLGAELFGNPDD